MAHGRGPLFPVLAGRAADNLAGGDGGRVPLGDTRKARLAIVQWLQRNLQAVPQDASDAACIERYYRKYADLDPDLADLSLLALAERTGVRDILTVDTRDFAVYRLASGRALNNLLAK